MNVSDSEIVEAVLQVAFLNSYFSARVETFSLQLPLVWLRHLALAYFGSHGSPCLLHKPGCWPF